MNGNGGQHMRCCFSPAVISTSPNLRSKSRETEASTHSLSSFPVAKFLYHHHYDHTSGIMSALLRAACLIGRVRVGKVEDSARADSYFRGVFPFFRRKRSSRASRPRFQNSAGPSYADCSPCDQDEILCNVTEGRPACHNHV